MRRYFGIVLVFGVMQMSSMIEEIRPFDPVKEEPVDIRDRYSSPSFGRRGNSLSLSPLKLRSNPESLRTLSKPVKALVVSGKNEGIVVDGGALQEEGLTEKERDQLKREAGTTMFGVKKSEAQLLSSAELQKQIQRAEDTLVRLLKLADTLHIHTSHAEDLSLVEEQLNAVKEFEERMNNVNAEAVQESGLPEKIAAVKAVLEDTISYKKEQIQLSTQEPLPVVVHSDDQTVSLLFLKQEEREKEQMIKIDSYLSQQLVKEILAKPIDSYTPSELLVNLEVLGLRDFLLKEQLPHLPVDSSQRAQLEEIQQFEEKAFQKLEKEVPDLSTVQDNILEQLGSMGTGGVFRKQAEEKIAFLQSKEIMSRLDALSQEYVQQAIAQFREGVSRTIALLLHPDERLVSSLEKALSANGSEVYSNSGYDQQNELYRSLLQVELAHTELFRIVSGISLSLDFARDKYISQVREFEKICGRQLMKEDPSNKDIVQVLKIVMSPDYAMTFVDSSKENEQVLGKQLSRAVGKEVLAIPLSSLADEDGYIVSEIEGQQIKIAFEKLIKEQGRDLSDFFQLPLSWQYISHDFLKEVGENWLRHFAKNKNDFSDITQFKKEQILCEAWQISRMDLKTATGRINIFRQIGTELMTYPMARSLLLESLESENEGKEIFSPEQKANAARLTGSLFVKESPLLPISDEDFKREGVEQVIKMESVKKYFPQSIRDFSMYCGVRQGAARSGVEFLENIQTALFDADRVTQLTKQKKLLMVVKELTAFQEMVLQGKSVEDFSLDWWQIELYQRADLFKQTVRALDDATISGEMVEEQVQNFVKNISVVLGDYQASSKKMVEQKREALVLEQSTVFQAQAKQWERWDTQWKGQKSFESDELLLVREQQKSLSQFLEQLPVLLKQVSDVLVNDPKSLNVKKFKAYKKQLEGAQKKYAPYVKRWNTILENNPIGEVIAPSKLQISYQQKAKALVDMIKNRSEGDKWQSLDREYTQAVAKDEGISSVLLNRMVKAKAKITQFLAEMPTLLEEIDEYDGILSRSLANEALLVNLKAVRKQLVDQEGIYKNYVARWEKGLRKFGPHS